MTPIIFFQIFFSLAILLFTGNLGLPALKKTEKNENDRIFFSKNNQSNPNNLRAASSRPLPPSRKTESRSVGIETTSAAVAVIDVRSGKTLFEKKADLPMSIASITKLMTALVVLDTAPDWEREVEVLEEDARESPASLYVGELVKLRDLFYATLVSSDNTAAAVLGRVSGENMEEFVARMNAKAFELGMLNAHFTDCTGLDPANTATALDVAVLSRAAFSKEEIRQALITPAYTLTLRSTNEERIVKTTDRLLDGYLNRGQFYIQGGKTGYLEESGFNFVFEVKGDKNQDLVIVVLGSETQDGRFEEAKNLALWAFENFDWEK